MALMPLMLDHVLQLLWLMEYHMVSPSGMRMIMILTTILANRPGT